MAACLRRLSLVSCWMIFAGCLAAQSASPTTSTGAPADLDSYVASAMKTFDVHPEIN